MKNPFEKNIEKNCSVCNKSMLVDISGNGYCPYCGWYNSILIRFDRSAKNNINRRE